MRCEPETGCRIMKWKWWSVSVPKNRQESQHMALGNSDLCLSICVIVLGLYRGCTGGCIRSQDATNRSDATLLMWGCMGLRVAPESCKILYTQWMVVKHFPTVWTNGRIIILLCLKLLLVHYQHKTSCLMALYVLDLHVEQFWGFGDFCMKSI